MGVFARWVAGFRVYARGVFVWVFACFGVGALAWGGGAVWSRRPSLRSLPSGGWGFGAHAFGVGVVGVCAVLRCGSNGNGAGQSLSRPYVLLVSLPPLRCVQEKGWGALVVC